MDPSWHQMATNPTPQPIKNMITFEKASGKDSKRFLVSTWVQLGPSWPQDPAGWERLGVLAGCFRQAFVPKPPQDPPKTPQDPPKTSPRHPKTPRKPPQDLPKCFNNGPKSLPEAVKNEVQIQHEKAQSCPHI